jgi:hypothetical protein
MDVPDMGSAADCKRMVRHAAGQVAVVAAALLLVTVACSPTRRARSLSIPDVKPGTRYQTRDWSLVVEQHVIGALVDYQSLAIEPDPLAQYMAVISVTGPTVTPEAFSSWTDRVAYWINAYNACALWAVLQRYPVRTMYDLSLPRFEYDLRFKVDGRTMTLYEIEQAALSDSKNDIRILFALSRAAKGTPPLAAEVYESGSLDQQLARAAARALDQRSILHFNHRDDVVEVWQVLLRREDLIREYWQSRRRVRSAKLVDVLAGLAGPLRREQFRLTTGYQVHPIPFDRALNDIIEPAGSDLIP